VERGDISSQELQQALGSQKRVGQLLEREGLVPPEAVAAAAGRAAGLAGSAPEEGRARSPAPIRPRACAWRPEKLDSLVDRVGELVIAQARLSAGGEASRPGLISIAEEIERLSSELRDTTSTSACSPSAPPSASFKRLVRDSPASWAKEIELVTEGAETELDKDRHRAPRRPLVHLIRNSCDHGIELPEAREAAGKPRPAPCAIGLPLRSQRVRRDPRRWAGLDPEALRLKASSGAGRCDARLSDKELFASSPPGCSTAKAVSRRLGPRRGHGRREARHRCPRGTVEIEAARAPAPPSG